MTGPNLQQFLVVAAALFCLGAYGALTRRQPVAVLIAVEMMLCAGSLNLAAFARFGDPRLIAGQSFAVLVALVAVAQAAVGVALALNLARQTSSRPGETGGSGAASAVDGVAP